MRTTVALLCLAGASGFRRPLRLSKANTKLNALPVADITSLVTAYSDDQNAFLEGFSPVVAGSIGATTLVIGGLFAVLAQSLGGGSRVAVDLTEEEDAAVTAAALAFDTAADQELTEAGTIGEVRRKAEAVKAKDRFNAGKEGREVRDKTLAYAEVDLPWLATLLRQVQPAAGETFLDLGSGMGRAVVGTAALYPSLAKVTGIEILPDLHKKASGYARKLRTRGAKTEFVNADFCDVETNKKVASAIGEADIIFAFATRFASVSDTLTEMSAVLAEYAKPGARIITLDRRLRGPFKLEREIDDLRGDLQLTRGYIYTKVEA